MITDEMCGRVIVLARQASFLFGSRVLFCCMPMDVEMLYAVVAVTSFGEK